MSERIAVVLADDHAPTRADVQEALERDARFRVRAAVATAPEAIAAALRHRPDVCLLDVNMPGNGVAAAWEIAARCPSTKVVMLTVSADDRDLFAALRAGASGYLLKDVDPARLPLALADVLSGEAAMPRLLVQRVLAEFRDRSARRRQPLAGAGGEELTSREWEVLELLRQGFSTGEIAERLVLSPVTVRSHVAAVVRKLRVPDREAVLQLFAGR
jgi:two-component system, NarL family, nitrate/nitrite response regulator NarL